MSCCNCKNNFKEQHLRILVQCGHIFCCECLVTYLAQIDKPKIKCIVNNCNKIIKDKIIRECLTDEQIQTYEKLSVLDSSQGAVKCLTKQCAYFFIHEKAVVFECAFCGAPNCTKCKKRHYINDCGRNTANEEDIEGRAQDTLKNKKRKELEELRKKHKDTLMPNPDSFECPVCYEFFLPRVGIILRNCLHSFCRDCLSKTMKTSKYINNMTCLNKECAMSLDMGEINMLITENKMMKMMIKEGASRFFQCKSEDCFGIWDVSDNKEGCFKCPVCSKMNCLACQDIHEGKSCAEFKNSGRYISPDDLKKMKEKHQSIQCYLCQHVLIRKRGSSNMFCNNCGSNTCILTGKISGRHNTKTCDCMGAANCTKMENYCGCTAKVLCHVDCRYGCYPEYDK